MPIIDKLIERMASHEVDRLVLTGNQPGQLIKGGQSNSITTFSVAQLQQILHESAPANLHGKIREASQRDRDRIVQTKTFHGSSVRCSDS